MKHLDITSNFLVIGIAPVIITSNNEKQIYCTLYRTGNAWLLKFNMDYSSLDLEKVYVATNGANRSKS